MRKTLTLAALTAILAMPMIAAPTEASASCHSRKTTGTVLGAVGGALLGNAVSHGGGGAVVGGVGGAVVGHEIGRSGCRTTSRSAARRAPSRYAAAQPSRAASQTVYYDRYGNRITPTPVSDRR